MESLGRRHGGADGEVTTTTPERFAGPFDEQLSSRLLQQRIIVLGQEVDDAVANRLCAALLLLSAEDPHRDISVYINSPGGLAASMGQFLLMAGTPGKRYVLPHARVLLHQGSAGIGGTAIDIEIQAENLEYTKDVMMGLTSEHTGQPVEKVERDALRDRWFTAEEAKEYGFVDRVLTDVRAVAPVRGTAAFASMR